MKFRILQYLPNTLTWVRVGLIPVMVICIALIPKLGGLLAAVVFLIAALTDFFDGLLARSYRLTSRFGEFFDPVADKLLVAAALLLLLAVAEPPWPRWILALLAGVIIVRELAVSAMREWSAREGYSDVTAVSWIGKAKTASQLAALPILLASISLPEWRQLAHAGGALLIVAALLGLASMVVYLQSLLRAMD
ncbi:MAG: CDP-diacylglycerol--glycerol-3-phosphate 3-phosphatidyltransferase [Betaproteobacteria bacterium]|nr:CDP-diacylglycerol--glycerol-3-phosphate 3-phosphatidyltransferase [Betaproteobacteria bacterium]